MQMNQTFVHPNITREPFVFQSTVNGLNGRGVVNHADKDSRQGLFWFLQKMEARVVQVQEARSAIQKFVHVRI